MLPCGIPVDLDAPIGRGTGLCLERDCFPKQCLATGADSGSFTLLCDNSAKKTELEIYAALGGAGDGQPLSIEISGGWAKVVTEGEAGAAQDGGDVIAKANGFAIKPLLAVLKADVAPTITVNGINTLFGDSGRTEAVAEFAKACRLD